MEDDYDVYEMAIHMDEPVEAVTILEGLLLALQTFDDLEVIHNSIEKDGFDGLTLLGTRSVLLTPVFRKDSEIN